jgi:hypothetical protein
LYDKGDDSAHHRRVKVCQEKLSEPVHVTEAENKPVESIRNSEHCLDQFHDKDEVHCLKNDENRDHSLSEPKTLLTQPLQETAVMRKIKVVEIFTKVTSTKATLLEDVNSQYCRVRIPNNHQLRRMPRYYEPGQDQSGLPKYDGTRTGGPALVRWAIFSTQPMLGSQSQTHIGPMSFGMGGKPSLNSLTLILRGFNVGSSLRRGARFLWAFANRGA